MGPQVDSCDINLQDKTLGLKRQPIQDEVADQGKQLRIWADYSRGQKTKQNLC